MIFATTAISYFSAAKPGVVANMHAETTHALNNARLNFIAVPFLSVGVAFFPPMQITKEWKKKGTAREQNVIATHFGKIMATFVLIKS
ncbi:hypothetical protein ACQKDS_12650 [Serratia sp. NPDC078593]|uniref:hypothetical protein n=1 Tax=unclassified Serratia (in: enterobacteria) TaxID=2647522 RepID=UPI0037D3DBD1